MSHVRRSLVSVVCVAMVAIAAPTPAFGFAPPETLVSEAQFAAVAGGAAVVDPSFAVDYVGVSWVTGRPPQLRFRTDGRWSQWDAVHEDGHPAAQRRFSALEWVGDGDAFQLRGDARSVRAVAINTTDGPRARTVTATVDTAGAELAQPGVITRAEWGADESLRFEADGSETWTPAFYPTQKLVTHHTATRNDDPDPAATVRAIYRYHAIDKGWGDIGYNFLVDAQGRIYKGRWSGPAASKTGDTSTGEDAEGNGVTAAHVGGYNSGTMGIALLGDYEQAQVPTAARQTLVNHLAWEAQRHGLDPEASSTYVNPVNGTTKVVENISGHKDWGSTLCPGRNLYGQLDSIRSDIAAAIAADGATTDPEPKSETTSYPSSVEVVKGSTSESGVTGFAADDDSDRYDVTSVKQGRNAVTVSNATVPVGSADGLLALAATLDARYTSSTSQTLAVYDVSAGKWVDVSTATIGTSDIAVSWRTTSPKAYVNGDGNMRLQVRSSGRKAQTAGFDLLSVVATR